MPLRLSPLAGEAFVAYLVRVARFYSIQPRDAAELMSLETSDLRRLGGMPAVWSTEESRSRVAKSIGSSYEVADAMFRRGERFNWNLAAAQVSSGRSRFCPRCLGEQETWQAKWQSSWSITCAKHQTLLRCACPECELFPILRFQSTWPDDVVENQHSTVLTECGMAFDGRGCGFPLDHSEAVSLIDDEALLEASAHVDGVEAGEVAPTFAGSNLTATFYLQNLKDLLAVLRRLPPHLASRPDYGDDERGNRRTLATWLPVATDLADSTDVSVLTARLTRLFKLAYIEERIRFPKRTKKSVLLGPCFKVIRESMPDTVHITTGPSPRPRQTQTNLLNSIEPHNIPNLLWEEAFEDLKQALHIPEELEEFATRRVLSKVVQELALKDPQLDGFVWPNSDGLPLQKDSSNHRWHLEVMRHRNGDTKLVEELLRSAEYWCIAQEFPDYRTRRHQFRTTTIRQKRWTHRPQWNGIDEATWLLIVDQASMNGVDLHEFVEDQGREFCSAIIRSKAAGTSALDEVKKFAGNDGVRHFLDFSRRYRKPLKYWLDIYAYIICQNPRQTWEYVYVRMEMAIESDRREQANKVVRINDRQLSDAA